MKRISDSKKETIDGGTKWTAIAGIGLIGQSLNSVLSLINQVIYNSNPNPYYNRNSIYNDSASKIFVRAQNFPWKSTVSFGSPYL